MSDKLKYYSGFGKYFKFAKELWADNVIKSHLPIMGIGECRNCEWWDRTRHMWGIMLARPCMYMKTPADPIELTYEEHSCIHWEGEQRTGDEAV